MNTYRSDSDLGFFDSLDGRFCKRLHPHPPLGPHDWFNDILRLAAKGESHRIVVPFDVQSFRFQCINDFVTSIKSLHALKFASVVVKGPIVVHNINEFQVVLLAYFEVVGIVSCANVSVHNEKY